MNKQAARLMKSTCRIFYSGIMILKSRIYKDLKVLMFNNFRYMMGQYVTVHGEVISHVNISRSLVDDGGLFTCMATNRAGSTSHSARLNIYGEIL